VAERPLALPPQVRKGVKVMLPSTRELDVSAAEKELERLQRAVNQARSEAHEIRMAAVDSAATSLALVARADRALARK
jgi:hypothetical protein